MIESSVIISQANSPALRIHIDISKLSADALCSFHWLSVNENEVASNRLPKFKSTSRNHLVPRVQLNKAEGGNSSSRILASLC